MNTMKLTKLKEKTIITIQVENYLRRALNILKIKNIIEIEFI